MAITDPSPFVPDESPDTSSSDKWLGQGPAMAASGNIGGLMQALSASGAPTTPAPSKGILSRDQIDRVSDTMASRIRTPDQMAAGKAERRGAFDQMKEANLAAAQDDWSPQRYMALGSMEGQLLKPWDAGSTSAHGTMRAYQAELDQINALKKAKLDNAKGELGFQQGEEKSDDANEKNVLSDYAKMAAAQARVEGIQAKMNNPLSQVMNLSGSLVYKGQFDANGTMIQPPRVLIPSGKKQELEAKFLKMAEDEAANNLAQFKDGNGMTAMEAKQKWVNDRAKGLAQEFLINSIGNGPSTMVAGSGPAASTAPGVAATQAATGNPATTAPLTPPGAAGAPRQPMQNAYKSGVAAAPAPGGAVTNGNIRAAAGVGDIPDEMATPQYLAYIDSELKKPGLNQEQIGALQGERQRVQAKLSAAPGAPASVVKMPNAELQTSEQQKGENTRAEGQNKNILADVQKFKGFADGAPTTISAMDNVLALGKDFTPQAFNDWKAKAAPFLQAFGIAPETAAKWGKINDAQIAITRAMNDEIKNQPDAARFTDKDAERVMKEMSSVTNTADAYKLAAKLKKEMAYRSLDIAGHVSPLQNDQEYIKGNKLIGKAAMEKTQSMGPSFMQLPAEDGKGSANKFRHEFVGEVMKLNKLNMDDTSERGQKVRAAAEKAWNDMAAKRGLK